MKFIETKLKGAYIIKPDLIEDERGFFARTYDNKLFEAHGLNPKIVQCNISFNKKIGALRGMHYQAAPHEEDKLVRCTWGEIYDVILDLRSNSPTFKQWVSVELSAENRIMVYIPKGFAHGFQTLEDDSEVFCQMSEYYQERNASGARWDDPAFGIEWPIENPTMSEHDKDLKPFEIE